MCDSEVIKRLIKYKHRFAVFRNENSCIEMNLDIVYTQNHFI